MKTVLCVEDDRLIGEMYVRSLKRAGYDVDWVVDGGDGLVAAKSKKYDFILIDIMLPNKRGDELVDALRENKELIEGSKVIIMTNYQQDGEDRLRMEEETDAYLIKADITPKKLLEVMEQLSRGDKISDEEEGEE